MGEVKNHYFDEINARFDHDYDEPDECESCGLLFFGMTGAECATCKQLDEQDNGETH